jgi:hypothetical protein
MDEELQNQLQLLATHRKTLAHLLHQRAIHGAAYVPPSILHGIDDARTQIRRIKQVLRDGGMTVADQPDDDEAPPVEQPPPQQQQKRTRAIAKKNSTIITAALLGLILLLGAISVGNQRFASLLRSVRNLVFSAEKPADGNDPRLRSAVSAILFECYSGLCTAHVENDIARTVVQKLGTKTPFRGFAYSVDGTKFVYGMKNDSAADKVDIYMANSDGSNAQLLFTLNYLQSVSTDTKVLGLSKDNIQIIFEENAQVFVSNLDGSMRRAVTPILHYGASSTHYFYVSPDASCIMLVGTGLAYQLQIYRLDGTTERFELKPQVAIIGFGHDVDHILAVGVDPAYQTSPQINEAAQNRSILRLEEINLRTGAAKSLLETNEHPKLSTMIRSNVSNSKTIFGAGEKMYYVDLGSGSVVPFTHFDIKRGGEAHGYRVATYVQ